MVKINKYKDESVSVIEIEGEVDASSSITLDEAIGEELDKGEQKIIIDCQQLKYISSAGLGVFMSYIQEISENNVKMILFGLSEKVFNVFKILGLHQLLEIVENKEVALQKVNEV